jgi:hypothetical protein
MLTNWRLRPRFSSSRAAAAARRRQIQENAFESMALAQALEIATASGLEDEEQFHQKLAITVNAG